MTDTMTMNEPETSRQTKPIVPLQPFYDRDGITIYHGDCRDVLPSLGRFDLMLTDPPYELTATQKVTGPPSLAPNTE